MIYEMFPPVVLALNEECKNHPKLLAELARIGPQPLEIQIGVVAAYCEVMLDGEYLEEDLEILYELLLRRLKKISAIQVH